MLCLDGLTDSGGAVGALFGAALGRPGGPGEFDALISAPSV